MTVAMMQIGIVRVLVPYGLVAVHMGMGFRHVALMVVLMVVVMHMRMIMLKFGMDMLMLMAFGQVKPSAESH